MKKIFISTLLIFWAFVGFGQLTVEKIMEDPAKWIGTSPSGVSWSDDSKTVYFNWNPEQNMADSLYKITLGTNMEPEKVALSEKRKLIQGGGFFMRNQAFSSDYSKKAFIRNGDLFLLDLDTFQERQLIQTQDRKSGIAFSGDDSKVLYSVGNNIFAVDLKTNLISQLSNFSSGSEAGGAMMRGGMAGGGFGSNAMRGGAGRLGDADRTLEKDQMDLFEVLREAKEKREAGKEYTKMTEEKGLGTIPTFGKPVQGAAISPRLDFVFYQLSEPANDAKRTFVPNYLTASGYTESIPTRTKVGQPVGSSEAYIYNIAKDTTLKISLESVPGIYDEPEFFKDYPDRKKSEKKTLRAVTFSAPVWSPSGTHAIVNLRAGDNKDRWIMKLNPETAELTLLDRQHDDAWIAGPGVGGFGGSNIGFIDENTLYFQSEATGYSHLYTVNVVTGEKKQLTSGDFEVQSVYLSKDKRHFYISTNEVHPGETHYYKMSVNGGERVKITQMSGGNQVFISPDEKHLAILYSNPNTPWELYIQENDPAAKAVKITSSLTDAFKSYPWRTPEVISFKARDGKEIYARIYEPAKRVKNKKAVIFVHGAGYLQNAHKWWSQYFREYMFHNLLADKGYTVLDIDYRASSGYGRDVRTGIYRHMGGKDLTDQVDGADLLVKKYGINPKKIGIYGGSYGGFITLMAMFTTPDVFAAGAALRPVTDWAAYNQGYTANILNNPQDDPIAYRRSSPIFFAEGLKGKLLMCHGQVDVNVHIQDTYRLAQRLIELRKENWEVASYPVEDHGFVQPTSWMDEYKRILKIFEEM